MMLHICLYISRPFFPSMPIVLPWDSEPPRTRTHSRTLGRTRTHSVSHIHSRARVRARTCTRTHTKGRNYSLTVQELGWTGLRPIMVISVSLKASIPCSVSTTFAYRHSLDKAESERRGHGFGFCAVLKPSLTFA